MQQDIMAMEKHDVYKNSCFRKEYVSGTSLEFLLFYLNFRTIICFNHSSIIIFENCSGKWHFQFVR